jgi:hypothetical protein
VALTLCQPAWHRRDRPCISGHDGERGPPENLGMPQPASVHRTRAVHRHTTPLTGLPCGPPLMRHAPATAPAAGPPHGGGPRCTRATGHRGDSARDACLRAGHTPSASLRPWAPPLVVTRARHGSRPGPPPASDGRARRIAPPASAAPAHAGASAGASPSPTRSAAGPPGVLDGTTAQIAGQIRDDPGPVPVALPDVHVPRRLAGMP